LYLTAADEQFTDKEQVWIDNTFGEGTGDQFLESFKVMDWGGTFDRMAILLSQITQQEKRQLELGLEGFLLDFLSVDGLNEAESERLIHYVQFLHKLGVQVKSVAASEAEAADESKIKTLINIFGKGIGELISCTLMGFGFGFVLASVTNLGGDEFSVGPSGSISEGLFFFIMFGGVFLGFLGGLVKMISCWIRGRSGADSEKRKG
jgi:hypothetical protein